MVAIKIYKIPVKVDLSFVDHGVLNNNMPFRDNDFKLYKGTYNPVEFVIRDNDRKPISLVGRSVTMTVLDINTNALVLQRDVEMIDAQKGSVKFTFVPNDIVDWTIDNYKYTLSINLEDGTDNLLSVDQHNTAIGFFELNEGALPGLIASVKEIGSDFTEVNEAPPSTAPTRFVSSAFAADSFFGDDDGLHTMAVYVTNYAGRFFVEGSLEESPSSADNEWFTIHLNATQAYHEFGNTPLVTDTFTGIEAFNFTASVRWVRVKHIPDDDNPGTFDQLLYRH